MDTARIQELIEKYEAGLLDPTESKELEAAIESGEVDLNAFADVAQLQEMINKMEDPSPSMELDDKFYTLLKGEIKPSRTFSWTSFWTAPAWVPSLTFASVTLIIGVAIGLWFRSPGENNEKVVQLTEQVSDLKEMVMLSLLEKESASDRLKAVSLTEEMSSSDKVADALLQTLNKDENVNVRLAALEALYPYARNNRVRAELIRSIGLQDSPLVQVSLAEFMVAIQERSSVSALEKVMKNERTPKEVREKLKESIQVLI